MFTGGSIREGSLSKQVDGRVGKWKWIWLAFGSCNDQQSSTHKIATDLSLERLDNT
jgi:hypothetical protein